MDVGLSRSVWFTPGRPDYTESALPAAPEGQDVSQPSTLDEGDSSVGIRTSEELDATSRIRALLEGDAAREKILYGKEASGLRSASESVPEDVKRLMDQLAPLFRTLMGSDRMGEGAKRALAQALTQSESDVDQSSDSSTDAKPIDADERYQKMKAAVDAFHASLKQIFRIEDDSARAERSEGPSGKDEKEEHSGLGTEKAGDMSSADDGKAKRADGTSSEREDLPLQPPSAARRPVDGEEQDSRATGASAPSDAVPPDQPYARLTAMYAALHASASDRDSSLNTEG